MPSDATRKPPAAGVWSRVYLANTAVLHTFKEFYSLPSTNAAQINKEFSFSFSDSEMVRWERTGSANTLQLSFL